jgi:hypothetical protein
MTAVQSMEPQPSRSAIVALDELITIDQAVDRCVGEADTSEHFELGGYWLGREEPGGNVYRYWFDDPPRKG